MVSYAECVILFIINLLIQYIKLVLIHIQGSSGTLVLPYLCQRHGKGEQGSGLCPVADDTIGLL